MKSPNPYEPPRTDSQLEELETPRIYVDGKYLVVASGVELPHRCVKTNQPVSERDAVHQTLQWRGRTFQLMTSEHQCEIVWYATPRIVWEHRAKTFAETFVWVGFVLALFFLNTTGIWPKLMLACATIVLLLNAIIKPKLQVVNFKNHRFWIQGCCREFLKSLQNELRNGRDSL